MTSEQASPVPEGELPASSETSPHRPWGILIGLAVGVVLGLLANALLTGPDLARDVAPANGIDDRLEWFVLNFTRPFGTLFLRLIMSVVVPLVFSALVLGVVGIGEVGRLGRIGLWTLLYTAILSLSSVVIGLGLVNTIKPGFQLSAEKRGELLAQFAPKAASAELQASAAKPLREVLLDIIPENPLQEMVGALDGSSKGNGMLAVMAFAVLVGVAMLRNSAVTRPLVPVLESLFAVAMGVIDMAMKLAPYAVAALLFSVTSIQGGEMLTVLLWFIVTVVAGLLLQLFVVYPILLYVVARKRPLPFFRSVSEAMITAFATSSSNATLPTALRVAEEELKLPPSISRFVLTVGATGNQNGTALFEGVVVLFLAQVFGVDLGLEDQIRVVLMAVLAGVGTAGIPGGSIPLIVVVLRSVNVPAEGIALILGIDRILDMSRTVLNVTGDLTLATCVSRHATDTAIEPEKRMSPG